MERVWKWAAGGIAAVTVGAMVVMAYWPGSSAAQEGTATPAATATAEADEDRDFFWGFGALGIEGLRLKGGEGWPHLHFFGIGSGDGEFLADVAAKLGVTEDELRGAVEEVARERLATRIQEQVTEGRLTQAEADEYLDAIENGTLDELLKSQARERLEERLAEAVADGRLTQEQADEMLEALDAGTLDKPFRFGGRGQWGGGHRGHHGLPGFFFGGPADSATPDGGDGTTPSANEA